MRTKIIDLGQLKVWHKHRIKEGNDNIIRPKDLIVELKGKEIQNGIQDLTIYFRTDKTVWFEIKMVPIYDRIKYKLKKALGGKT